MSSGSDMPVEESMAKGSGEMTSGNGVVLLTAGGESLVGSCMVRAVGVLAARQRRSEQGGGGRRFCGLWRHSRRLEGATG